MKLNYKLKKKNYDFWAKRSKKKDSLVCTNDPRLDQLEIDQILNKINNNKSILEVGCGNGFILKRLLKEKKIKSLLMVTQSAEILVFMTIVVILWVKYNRK